MENSRTSLGDDESGLALLITVFVIALGTVLVMNLQYGARFDQQASRSFSEEIQADFVLKSGLVFGRMLLELPKEDGGTEDWLGDDWAQFDPWIIVAVDPALALPFPAEPRLKIVDEDGKVDLNWILERSRPNQPQNPASDPGSEDNSAESAGGNDATNDPALFWKNTLRELFAKSGFQRELYPAEQYRTFGNTAYSADQQVAVIHDWLDKDSLSYSSANFNGEGIESGADRSWFYNRRFQALTELLLVPGMTLERLGRIAPFVRVSATTSRSTRINVNTAPPELLLAIGFPETIVNEIVVGRETGPISKEDLNTLIEGDVQLPQYTKLSSNEFSIFSRVSMPSTRRWLRAVVATTGTGSRRRTRLRLVEFY